VLFLTGLMIAGQVQKFCAIQPNSLGPAPHRIIHLRREFNISLQTHHISIERLSWQILEQGQIALHLQPPPFRFAMLADDLLIGVDDDHAHDCHR